MSRIENRRTQALRALLAVVVGASILAGAPAPAQSAPPGPYIFQNVRPTIAFVKETRTFSSYDAEIYTVDGYGMVTQLTSFRGVSLSPAWSPDGRQLAFVRTDSAYLESGIYVMDADGSNVRRLSDGSGGEGSPAWSPDGSKIAFEANRDGDYDIFIMNADGSGVHAVTANDVDDENPTWSPDGTKLAFDSERPGIDSNREIWVIGADGGGLVNVTQTIDCDETDPEWRPDAMEIAYTSCDGIRGIRPDGSSTGLQVTGRVAQGAWSPNGQELAYTDYGPMGTALRVCTFPSGHCATDGSQPDWQPRADVAAAANGRIAFSSDRDGNRELYAMGPDGTGQTRLTTGPEDDLYPLWSVDGRQLAWSSDYDIVRMPANGGPRTPVATGPSFEVQPTWSPDGSRVAFVSDRTGDLQIFVIGTNGTGLAQLTNVGFNVDPVWSRDGSSIVFTSNRDGNEEIYVMSADGSNQRRLTNEPGRDYGPYFSPSGTAIVFQSDRDGNSELYVMGRSGAGQTRLTNDPGNDTGPAWSPDGTKIVFASNRDGDYEIFTINPDGSGLAQLTTNTSDDRYPDWQAVVSGGATDVDPPVLTLPAAVTANATSPAGASVSFSVTAADLVDPSPSVTCVPPSGSVFAVGSTSVVCTATDASGNAASGSFTVTVLGAAAQLADLARSIAAGRLPAASTAALVRLASRFDPADPVARRAACTALNAFVVVVRAASGRTIPAATASAWIADALRIRAVLGC